MFLYRKQVWRSLGKLVKDSHSVTAQRVFINGKGAEIATDNADFLESYKVELYMGKVPKYRYKDYPFGQLSEWQRENMDDINFRKYD